MWRLRLSLTLQVHPLVINPKSVTLSELYGAYDLSTFEWADGILSTLFKQAAESDKPDENVGFRNVGVALHMALSQPVFLCQWRAFG